MQGHSSITITALLDLLLDPRSAAGVVDAVGSQNFLRDCIRNDHVVQKIRPPRIVYHQVHALIAGRVNIVKDPRNFDSDRLTAMTNHLRQTCHQVIVRCVGQVAIEPTLLDMNTVRVDHFAVWARS